jgi:nitroreductase
MLTTKDAIEQRRSIRKFKPDPIPDEEIRALLDAARLAPSGSNAQPWRFKIVRDQGTKEKLTQAAYHQSFIADAPVVIICCADIKGYLDGTVSGIQDLGRIKAVEEKIVKIMLDRVEQMKSVKVEEIGPRIAVNVAIAIEHIVLRALDFDLGSCWLRLIDEQMVKDIFGWGENVFVVALLLVGYPAESPPPRKRLKLKDILME